MINSQAPSIKLSKIKHFLGWTKKILFKLDRWYHGIKKQVIIDYSQQRFKTAMELFLKVRSRTQMLFNNNDAYNIYNLVLATRKIAGDLAEVGVYKGGSAMLMAEIKAGRSLYLFDTFSGLPDVNPAKDDAGYVSGQYLASYDVVRNLLSGYSGVFIYPGLFPETGEPIKNKIFSFVHLDVDLYKSALESLKFFYPKMTRGGCILSHDYCPGSGVYKAYTEFLTDKPEIIIELSVNQCLLVKL